VVEDEDNDLQTAIEASKRTARAEKRMRRDSERSALAEDISPDASSLSSDEDRDDEQTMPGVQPPLITNEEYDAQMAEV
jgi:hypothetical protein